MVREMFRINDKEIVLQILHKGYCEIWTMKNVYVYFITCTEFILIRIFLFGKSGIS